MAGGARGGDQDELITEINVTPLVDVTLVLLIILMVTATAIVSKTVPVDLPNAATAEQDSQPATLSVSIDRNAVIYLDMERVTLAELGRRATEARANARDARAIVSADGNVAEGTVLEVIDTLRRANILKFSINVRPEERRRTSNRRH